MEAKFTGQHVVDSPDADTVKYANYTVVDLKPEDVPAGASPRMVDFVREHGDVVGLSERSLPDFASEVRHRYVVETTE